MSPDGAMMAVDATTGDTFSAAAPRELFRTPSVSPELRYDVSPDGQRFLLAASSTDEDAPITVVMNWWVELERRSR